MIVLTGGAGFIGSVFLKKLNDEGVFDILVVDRLGEEAKWKNLNGKIFNDYLHKDEFRKRINSGKYSKKDISAIIHLGACSATTERDSDYLMDNNYGYTKDLAKFAIANDVRFIYASSAATYGDGKLGYSDYEIYKLKPLNCYGFSKHIFDVWVMNNELYDKVTGIKFFNVFGPNEYHKGGMTSVFEKAYRQIKETGKVKLFKSYHPDYADGEQKRDFIYVKDCAEIMWRMLNDANFTGIYNLGTGRERSWNDLAKGVFLAMKKNPIIEYVDMPDSLKNQYQYFTCAESEKLLNKLTDFEFTSLEDAAGDYIQNYLMNEDSYI